MQRALMDLLYRQISQRLSLEAIEGKRHKYFSSTITYQGHALDEEGCKSQESFHNKSSEDTLDL